MSANLYIWNGLFIYFCNWHTFCKMYNLYIHYLHFALIMSWYRLIRLILNKIIYFCPGSIILLLATYSSYKLYCYKIMMKLHCICFFLICHFATGTIIFVEVSLVLGRQKTLRKLSSIWLTWLPPAVRHVHQSPTFSMWQWVVIFLPLLKPPGHPVNEIIYQIESFCFIWFWEYL